MSSNLVQLSYKPGIQRDGTKFQGDFCSDSQWIRFQRGKIKKIGGMKGLDLGINLVDASEIIVSPFQDDKIICYIASTVGVITQIVDNDFNSTRSSSLLLNRTGDSLKWQAEEIIKEGRTIIVFLATNNATNIAQNTRADIYYGAVGEPLISLDATTAGINNAISGGMCFSSPYLFLYGSNGLVQYSRNNDPLNFTIDTANAANSANSITISNDKVIWGRAIRGGPNSPSVLFWTLSSVVRVTNVGTDKTQFQTDVISKSSSILSSKCVVEYDGLFFWPGTDRFFVYNGTVQEIVNNTNLNYFFDNIDMDYRQKVFGVKNTRYGEIWWFYPEKVGTVGRNPALPRGTNTRALIYNKRENSWYDTAIYRDCGMFSEDFGYMVTYGKKLTTLNNNLYLWRHEYEDTELIQGVTNAQITSSVTTPIFGWSSFNPVYSANNGQKGQAIDRWIELRRIEPDFIIKDVVFDEISVVVNTQTYAQSPVTMSDPIVFNGTTGKIDLRVHGRQMSLTFSSGDYFEMGTIMMLVGIGDGQ